MAENNSEKKFSNPFISEHELRDMGFGSVVAGQSRERLLNQDGSFNVRRTGTSFFTSLNLFHLLMTMPWKVFLSLLLLLYFTSNIIFGLFYASLGAESLVDTSAAPTDSLFLRGFFFSVQTFATIGYGTIHPVGTVPNLLVTIESYYSMVLTALITGVIFARFARPTARIHFSRAAVVAPYRGIDGFMFRLVNGRSSQLIEVEATVIFTRFVEQNGSVARRFDSLELERKTVAFFPLAWTVVHPIDEQSPLYGLTPEDLKKSDAEFLVLLTAIDETFAQAVHTRSSYKPSEIRFGHKFVNMYNPVAEGEKISINIKKLSTTEKT
ncbi:MAG: channel, inward rectifier [Acidobacteria bacterium]|nr:channel, inward rectifier [Acidobacteriota bacterium]